jgi:hypothetical protein
MRSGTIAIVAAIVCGCGSPEQVVVGQGFGAPNAGDTGVDGAAATAQRVTGFELVDATTGLDIRALADGDTINVTATPVTLHAITAPAVVGSVVFAVDGKVVRLEEHPLYSIAGDDLKTGLPYAWTVAAGTHVVSATPYSAPMAMGVAGASLTQTFHIQ